MDKFYNVLGKFAFGLLVFITVVCLGLSQFKIVGDFERIEFNPHIPFFSKGDN